MNLQHHALRQFHYQINYAINHYVPHGLKATDFHNIVLGGLGGSGIGGRIVKSLFSADCPLPIEVVSDYHFPAYVNEKSLVILSSYSGNTEETLSLYSEAKQRNAKVLALSTGGTLKTQALDNGDYFLPMEVGFQPRMALGFSLTLLVQVLAELCNKNIAEELAVLKTHFADTKMHEDQAYSVFETIKNRSKLKYVVLSDQSLEPIAIRFAQQIQENAKHECFQHTLPEMNHNVIESYYGTLDSVFFFLSAQQNERINARFEFLEGLLAVENHKIVPIYIDGFTLKQVYELIHVLDWLSLYVADFRKVDSLNVPNISALKEFLEAQ
jgi:glucose/mannose-6-phosphate isomerase